MAPIEFSSGGQRVAGYWVTDLGRADLSRFPRSPSAFMTGRLAQGRGLLYRQHRPHWHFAEIPAWFRDQGAIYSHAGDTAGAIYLRMGKKSTKALIGSFENLPVLLKEAQSLGSNAIYLWDYWEGAIANEAKGDYIPAATWARPEAFARAFAGCMIWAEGLSLTSKASSSITARKSDKRRARSGRAGMPRAGCTSTIRAITPWWRPSGAGRIIWRKLACGWFGTMA